MDRHCARLH